jgi:hypothetical protein
LASDHDQITDRLTLNEHNQRQDQDDDRTPQPEIRPKDQGAHHAHCERYQDGKK